VGRGCQRPEEGGGLTAGPSAGGIDTNRRGQGQSAGARTVIHRSESFDRGRTVVMGRAGLYSSVTGVARSAAARSPEAR
jgi:hypothetical protein